MFLFLVACGVETIGSNGELGRMSFSFVSDHYQDEVDLTSASFVTNHSHRIYTELTEDGEKLAEDKANQISYRLVGSSAELSQDKPDEDNPEETPAFSLLAEDATLITVEATLDGELFDRISLDFARPDALELVLFARGPWEEEFIKVDTGAALEVTEGTQVAWLAIPNREGKRLLGDIVAEMSADPIEKVVPAANVEYVNEETTSSIFRADSFYFIEEGEVNITILDAANSVSGAQLFTVSL
jgi:hypothetical protein